MKKKIFLLSIMSIVALTAASDEYIDPLTNVVYTYEPDQLTASVKAGYEEVVAPEYGSELDVCYYPGSPDAAGDVVILDKFTIGTTEYVVTSIGDCAFWYNRKIKSVVIPNSVTDIGSWAFHDCTDLATVQLPSGLMEIAEGLFSNCSRLVSVNIPSSVSTIGAYAFAECGSLANITIPDVLSFVGKFAFNGTPWYASQYDNAPDGLFYINSLLFGYKGEKPTGELIIKDGTTCICKEAFRGCKELTSVIIPPSVAYVDEYAFEDCTGLKAVHITNIAAWCGIEFQYGFFNRNSSNPLWYARHLYLDAEEITELVVPEGVTRIGKYAFDNCSALTSVTLPNGVTSIGENAFRSCSNLTSVSIPSSVSKIESQAFIWCKKLNAVYISDIAAWCGISFDNTSNPLYYGARLYLEDEEVTDLIIPEGVSSIGDGAFRNCSYLTSVEIPEGVTDIGKCAFYGCSKITNLSLPTSLGRICYNTFAHCNSLASLTLSEGITNIDESAFADCGNLTDVYCLADNVPETNRIAFIDSPIESATLHVPAGSIEKYKTTSPWKDFGNIVPITYYPEGTKWTEIRLDTLKYDSWYSKVGDEWVPNFETVDYYVKGEYDGGYRDYKLVYTNGPEWTDSLTLLISESQYGLEVTVAVFHENEVFFPPGWAYGFGDWKEGNTLSYQTINGVNTPSIPPAGIREFGTITEIKEAYFGGVCPLKYVDLNETRIINGIGVTEWNDGECIFGPVDPYFCYYAMSLDLPKERHYRSMLVHFERNGEVLYDVWPAKETVSFTKDQMATIILPTEPDASKGKYYRLDRCEKGKIIFEEELSPKARTPYIIVPKEDFSIDLNALDLDGLLRDTVSVKGASFIGSYGHEELSCQDGFYIDIIDSTPDCLIIDADQRKAAVGALRAYLVAPWDDPYNPGGSKGITEKRELVLKDNPNGIESLIPNPSPSEKGTIYDLSGRKVNSQFSILNSQLKQKGLYIKDGKKILIK